MAKDLKTLASIPTPSSKPKEEPKAVKAVVSEPTALERRFDTLDIAVAYFKEQIEGIRGNVLKVYYEIGQEALRIKDKAVYGKASIETFAEKLEADPKIVYQYAQFAEKYTEAEFGAILNKEHVGWGAVMKLLSVSDKEVRKEFEDKLHAGVIPPSKLEEALREYKEDLKETPEKGKAGKAPAGAPNRNYIRNMQKMLGGIAVLENHLANALKDARDLDEIAEDEDKYPKALDVLFEVKETLERIKPDFDEFIKLAKKVV